MDIDCRLRHHYSGLLVVPDEQAEDRDCTKQAVNGHCRAGTRHGSCATAPGPKLRLQGFRGFWA